MSDMLVHESLSIWVVRSHWWSEFLNVNNFIFKLNVCQFLSNLSLVRSYHNTAGRCKSWLKNKLIRKSSWEEDSMILPNLMIQLNPIFVLINIIELITCLLFHTPSRRGLHRAWKDCRRWCSARFLQHISQSTWQQELCSRTTVCMTTNC